MQAYYNVLTNLKAKLEADEFVNTVTQGDIFDIDLNKQTIFPLAHIIINDVTKVKNILQFNVTVMCMDIVDLSKEETTDVFIGNDNEQDVLNTQMAVGLRLVELLERGSNNSQFMMRGEPTFEGFTERFENNIAGWAVTFDIHVPNTMTSCDDTATGVVCYPANYTVEYANGTLIESGSIASGSSKTITVPNCPVVDDATWTLKDADGNVLNTGTIPSGGTADITAPSASVNNSDSSYTASVLSDGSLTLPNSQINVNASLEGNVVSLTDVDINLTDSGGTVTPNSVTVTGNDVNITLADSNPTPVGATLVKTGQTTSYATGDDGDLQAGRATDAFTLGVNNPFSNTNRYTDELGGQTYTNDIVIDWSTYDNIGGTVLGYYRVAGGTDVWSDAVANAAATSVGTFTSGWRLTNMNELHNLVKINSGATSGQGRAFNWSPINQGNLNTRYWTSSTLDQYTNQPYYFGNFFGGGGFSASSAYNWIACRTFTVTGTTLS